MLPLQIFPQSPDSLPQKAPIDVNFLFNYYTQDGEHSAVTGGEGTQLLSDYDTQILLYVPLDTVSHLSATGGINVYTSASTDRIDNRLSSPSARDARMQLSASYGRKISAKNMDWAVSAGGSIESDYISSWVGASWSKTSADGNRSFQLAARAFFDTWIVYLPIELRVPGGAEVPTDKRRSMSLSATYTQVLGKRLQAALIAEGVWQNGLLSTPFHRVYLKDSTLATIEKLPLHRYKFPFGIRLNYFAGSKVVLRSFYRFYQDSWGIQAHSASLEIPVKIGQYFSFYPFYRFHRQTAARYFEPIGQHLPGAQFYTSDYDLSAFYSQKAGLGITISPLYGIFRMQGGKKLRGMMLKSIDLRSAVYQRSDGLQALIVALDLGFLLR